MSRFYKALKGNKYCFSEIVVFGGNGTNKASLPLLLLLCVLHAHSGTLRGTFQAIFISEFPQVIRMYREDARKHRSYLLLVK